MNSDEDVSIWFVLDSLLQSVISDYNPDILTPAYT